jgi:hypothetical protein
VIGSLLRILIALVVLSSLSFTQVYAAPISNYLFVRPLVVCDYQADTQGCIDAVRLVDQEFADFKSFTVAVYRSIGIEVKFRETSLLSFSFPNDDRAMQYQIIENNAELKAFFRAFGHEQFLGSDWDMLFSGGIHLTNSDGTPMTEPIYGFGYPLGGVAVINGPAILDERRLDTLAHELGHTLNLQHVNSDADNLMAPGAIREAPARKLTAEQAAIARQSLVTSQIPKIVVESNSKELENDEVEITVGFDFASGGDQLRKVEIHLSPDLAIRNANLTAPVQVRDLRGISANDITYEGIGDQSQVITLTFGPKVLDQDFPSTPFGPGDRFTLVVRLRDPLPDADETGAYMKWIFLHGLEITTAYLDGVGGIVDSANIGLTPVTQDPSNPIIAVGPNAEPFPVDESIFIDRENEIIATDTTPPITSIVTSSAPNANGWNRDSVAINLTALDNAGGSGVSRISLSLSGAQVGSGEVLSSKALVTISAEGITTVTYFATDNVGNQESPKTLTVRIDKTPPRVACTVSPNMLWPPNNQRVTVTASIGVSDSLSGASGFSLISVTSNEPFAAEDIQGFTPGTSATVGKLMSTRLGSGTGRIYTLTYQGKDQAGNLKACTTTVTVPHDQAK